MSAPPVLVGNVEVPFAYDSTVDTQPVLVCVFEMDDRKDPDAVVNGTVRIRRYPAAPRMAYGMIVGVGSSTPEGWGTDIKIVATEGAVYEANEIRNRQCSGRVMLAGTDRVTLQYPVVGGLSVSIDGVAYDIRGNTVFGSPALHFDPKRNEIRTSQPIYGTVVYSYTTSYSILRYTPSGYNEREMYYLPDPEDYGSIVAFVQNSPSGVQVPAVVFAVQPPNPVAAEFELYRVESFAIATAEKLWERPPSWPTSAAFPGSPAGVTLDTNASYVEIARVHEVAYFSLRKEDKVASSYGQSMNLPLNYSKELSAGSRTTVTTAQERVTISRTNAEKSAEYRAKYAHLQKETIAMRIQKTPVPWEAPYATTKPQAVHNVISVNSAGGSVVADSGTVYRVKLKPRAASAPVYEAIGAAAYGEDARQQAKVVNNHLALLWAGVDWAELKRRITEAYDNELYSFDWTGWPTN